eukprot:1149234-Pelagomonas_calceolata.AAC.15
MAEDPQTGGTLRFEPKELQLLNEWLKTSNDGLGSAEDSLLGTVLMMNRLLEKSCGMLPRSPFAALELRGTLVVLHLKLYASYAPFSLQLSCPRRQKPLDDSQSRGLLISMLRQRRCTADPKGSGYACAYAFAFAERGEMRLRPKRAHHVR